MTPDFWIQLFRKKWVPDPTLRKAESKILIMKPKYHFSQVINILVKIIRKKKIELKENVFYVKCKYNLFTSA